MACLLAPATILVLIEPQAGGSGIPEIIAYVSPSSLSSLSLFSLLSLMSSLSSLSFFTPLFSTHRSTHPPTYPPAHPHSPARPPTYPPAHPHSPARPPTYPPAHPHSPIHLSTLPPTRLYPPTRQLSERDRCTEEFRRLDSSNQNGGHSVGSVIRSRHRSRGPDDSPGSSSHPQRCLVR
jgi:hypothetical protein